MSSMLVALDHVQLAMPRGGEAEARVFYVGLLGFVEEAKPPTLAGRGGLWLAQNGIRLHLGVEEPFVAARKAHPAFLCHDLTGLRGRLREAGCRIVPDEAIPGVERFYVDDPFGNRIELMRASSPGRA